MRAVLAPTGHAAVHEARVAGEADVGADAEPLRHAGPESLGQRIGALDEPQHRLDAVGVLQVDRHGAAAAVHHRHRSGIATARHGLRAVDVQHVGTHVRQQHRGERTRADPGELDHLHTRQRSCHVNLAFLPPGGRRYPPATVRGHGVTGA